MTARQRRRLGLALEITVPLAILVAWAVWSAGAHSFYFPPLTDILSTFRETWLFDRFGSDIVPSLERLFAGFFLAVFVGIAVGIPLGLSAGARNAAAPIVEFLRAIPPPALIPLGIVVIGIGDSMKIFVIAFVCVWPVLLNTVDGIASVDPTLKETARVYGVPRHEQLWHVMLPSASPQIFTGVRTSLALSLIMMVISEMLASTSGIGFFILQSQRSFAIPEMWSGILLLGLLGYLLNSIFILVQRRSLAWHRGARASSLS